MIASPPRAKETWPQTLPLGTGQGVPFYAPWSIGLHSTEKRLTLHGEKAYAPRSIGLRSTERKTTPSEGTLHGTCGRRFSLLLAWQSLEESKDHRRGCPPGELRQLKKYYCPREKRRRRERPQTGVLTPGTSTLTKLSPERVTEYLTCLISSYIYLCRPLGAFSFVASLPRVNTPVCGLSRLRRLFSGQKQSPIRLIRTIRGFTIPSAFAIRAQFVAESFSPNPLNPCNPRFYNPLRIRNQSVFRGRIIQPQSVESV